MLKNLSETMLMNGENLLSQAIEYQGQEFIYDNIASLITIVTKNGAFTSEFQSEIEESFPEYATLSYQDAIGLVGISGIDDVLLSVAGIDGTFVS